MRTRETDEYEAQENVRCHPGPVSIPAFEHGQDDAEPDPVERDGPRARVADEEEECWRGKTADDAPPAGVFHEEVSEMPDRDEDDRGGLQPVGIVHRGRHAFRARRIVAVERIASVFLVPRHRYAKVFQSPQEYSHRRGNWALRRRSGGGLTAQVLLVFRASATGNEPCSTSTMWRSRGGVHPGHGAPKGWDRALDLRRSRPMHSRQGRRGLRWREMSRPTRDRSCATFSRQRTSASGVAAPC